jgi:nitroreductase
LSSLNVFDAVRTLLAVRQHQDRPIPDEVVHRIVEAAHLTASSMNKQPRHFVVVRDRERLRQLGGLVRTGPSIADAQLAIAVADEKASQFGVSDASRAVQSMMLTARAQGVGSSRAGFRGLDQVAGFLGLPAELDVLAVVPFGYPAQALGRGTKQRRPLGEVAPSERYGQAFE